MKKCTIILGPQGCGKTTLANKMAKNFETVALTSGVYHSFPKPFKPDVIVADGVPSLACMLKWIVFACREDSPSFILVSNGLRKADLKKYFDLANVEVIELGMKGHAVC